MQIVIQTQDVSTEDVNASQALQETVTNALKTVSEKVIEDMEDYYHRKFNW